MKGFRCVLYCCLAALLIFSIVPIARADSYPNSIEQLYPFSTIAFGMNPTEVTHLIGNPIYLSGSNGADLCYRYAMSDPFMMDTFSYVLELRFDSNNSVWMIMYEVTAPLTVFDPFIAMICDAGYGKKVQPLLASNLPADNADGATFDLLPAYYGRCARVQVECIDIYEPNIKIMFVPDASYLEPLPNTLVNDDLSPIIDSHSASSIGTFVKITGDVNVRDEASLNGKSLGTLSKGSAVEYLGESKIDDRDVKWYKVIFKNGSGWVSSKYGELTTVEPTQTGVNETSYALVTDAYRKNGKSYVTFDYVDLHFYSPGTKNAKGEVMDHDGVDIVNNSSKLRTYEVEAKCRFYMPEFFSLEYIDLTENIVVSFDHFQEHYSDIAYGDRPMIFFVTIQNSKLVACELWHDYYIGG